MHTELILLIKKELKMNYKSKKLIILIVKDILCFTCSPFCSSLFFFSTQNMLVYSMINFSLSRTVQPEVVCSSTAQ